MKISYSKIRKITVKVINHIISYFVLNRTRSYIVFGLLIIFLIFSYHWLNKPSVQTNKESKAVEVISVTRQDFRQTTRLIGTIRPKHSTPLIAKASGTLDILVTAGQSVSKGTAIAKIDNVDVEHNYTLSATAEAIAKDQYERAQRLSKAGHTSQKSVEDQKHLWIEAQKRLAAAKIDLDKTQFLAPFDGIVGVFKVREGSQVEIGNQVGSFYDPESLMVEFNVPDPLMRYVQDGQRLVIEGKTYALTHVQKMIDEETHMCPAYVDISCPTCLIGAAVDIELTLQEMKDTIVIPYQAVFLREDKPFVYTVKDNKTILTPVQLGLREQELIQVESGLSQGDLIVALQPGLLSPDSQVNIHYPK